jgi:hypothetical protein
MPAATRPMSWVLLAFSSGELRTHPLTAGGELLVGRDLDCDLVLDHHRVSRRHARLRVVATGDALAIEDLGSRSGTRVGEPLKPHQPRPVRPGESIGIGPFTLIAVRGAAQPPPPSIIVEDLIPSALPPPLLGIARAPGHVLVHGEPGAARQVLAEALHHLSGRGGRFVSIDCAALAPELLERELAATLESAGEGSVLLDEVGRLSPALQLALLHAVEDQGPAGAGEGVPGAPGALAARLVCAASHDLIACVAAGVFRLDLYSRVAGAKVAIRPPGVGLTADEEEERRQLLDALDHCAGNQTRAAKLLGISRGTLATKLSSYRVPRAGRTRK